MALCKQSMSLPIDLTDHSLADKVYVFQQVIALSHWWISEGLTLEGTEKISRQKIG